MTTHYYSRRFERNKKLLDYFNRHRDLKKCAKKFGINEQSVREVLKKLGLKFPKTKLRTSSACNTKRDLVIKMCNQGASLSHIAKHIGTSARHVKRFLRENGITRRFVSWSSKDKHYNWKGGRLIDGRGYVHVYSPNHPHGRKKSPYMFEHRIVMEKMIGRFLAPGEVVHHRNGIRGDNRPENLQLFSGNGIHLAFELKGRVPKWTANGRLAINKGAALRWKKWRVRNSRE